MALLTKKKFAELANMESRKLAIYVKRRKVVVDSDTDLIDPSEATNRAFLEKYGGQVQATPAKQPQVKHIIPAVDPDAPDEEEDDSGLMTLSQSEREYQHHRAVRNAKAVELAEIEIAKKRGVVIPSEFIKPLFAMYSQAVLTEMKIFVEDFVRDMGYQYNVPPDKVAAYKGKGITGLNDAITRAKDATEKGVVSIVENYIETK